MEFKKQLIFYVHGWGSSGFATKADILKGKFTVFFSPTLPVNADNAIHLLDQCIQLFKESYRITLVGSSLGGFYSIYLANKHPEIKAVLINPAIKPFEVLASQVGKNFAFLAIIYFFFSSSDLCELAN